jgi:hypothetical protein
LCLGIVFSFFVVGPPQRDESGLCTARGEYQNMQTTTDRAESAISYFAIILPIIDRDYSGVELEALDNRKIDAVFVQIVGTLTLVSSEPIAIHDLNLNVVTIY